MNNGQRKQAFLGDHTSFDKWHERLGHPLMKIVQKVLSTHGLSLTFDEALALNSKGVSSSLVPLVSPVTRASTYLSVMGLSSFSIGFFGLPPLPLSFKSASIHVEFESSFQVATLQLSIIQHEYVCSVWNYNF